MNFGLEERRYLWSSGRDSNDDEIARALFDRRFSSFSSIKRRFLKMLSAKMRYGAKSICHSTFIHDLIELAPAMLKNRRNGNFLLLDSKL